MATMMEWSDQKRQEQEQEKPIPPYTKVTAIRDFKAQHQHDLSFSLGDHLTVLEPCNVIFWYLAEDAQGKRGVIPINFVKANTSGDGRNLAPQLPPKPSSSSPTTLNPADPLLPLQRKAPPLPLPPRAPRTPHQHKPPPPIPAPPRGVPSTETSAAPQQTTAQGASVDIDSRPPAPLPPEAFVPSSMKSAPPPPPAFVGKYATNDDFMKNSGWFKPTVESVICRKADIHLPVFKTITTGVYLFKHRYKETKKYVGKSQALYSELVQMFNRLFLKPENKLNPLELEIKCNSPDADEWYVKLRPVPNRDCLNVEEAKAIVQLGSVKPDGLNLALEFYCQEDWYEFAAWYRGQRAKDPETSFPTLPPTRSAV